MRVTLWALLVVTALAVVGTRAAPAELQKLEDLKEKLRSLHDVLNELNQNIDALEEQQEKREFAPVPESKPIDEKLKNFLAQLSPEDKEAVQKMKSKMKFLQATVHEEPGVDVPAADGFAEEQAEKRGMDPDMKALYENLPDEDKKLLQANPSVWGHLETALKTPGGDAADAVARGTSKKHYEDELQQFVSHLSDDDKALLARMKSKVSSLKNSLREQNGQRSATATHLNISEGKQGAIVSHTEARIMDRGWQSEPAGCQGDDCKNDPDKPDVVNEVEQRFLNDMRYARQNGVTLKQVLKVLMDAKKQV